MFRDLCSCHKSKKHIDADDDDAPYSPKKKSKFFSFKKNTIRDKTLHSTPNQLVNVRKLSEQDNYAAMDMKNNNKFNLTPTNTNHSVQVNQEATVNLPTIITSPIERNSETCFNLDFNDELSDRPFEHSDKQFAITNLKVSPQLDIPRSSLSLSDFDKMNEKFSNLHVRTTQPTSSHNHSISSLVDCKSSNNHKSPNHSMTNIRSDKSVSHNRSENNLNHSNSRAVQKDNSLVSKTSDVRNSFFDSTDNILVANSDSRFQRDAICFNDHMDKEKFGTLNAPIFEQQPSIKDQLKDDSLPSCTNDAEKIFNSEDKQSDESNKEFCISNPILDLINLPKNTDTLKRVKSNEKLSFDTSSIDSVVLDKHANEIVRRSNISNQHVSNSDQLSSDRLPHQHPNSILIRETLTLTLKRDKNDKKSLNEFSIKDIPSHIFESGSFAKEYFYDEPVIKSSSKFIEPDNEIYRMQSDPRGVCIMINNATTNKPCLKLKNGFSKEINYLNDIFTRLGFIVQIFKNLNATAICKLMKSLKNKFDFANHDAFVCIYLGHGNSDYVIGEDNFKLNLELMIGCMNNYHCPNLIGKPKIFIAHTCNSTCQTFLEPIAPSNIPREVQALKKLTNFKIIPTWTDTVVIYAPFTNCPLYFSPFVKEFGLSLCNNAFELSLHDILLQTNDRICTKSQYKGQSGVNFIYRGFNKSLFFNPGHFF